MTEYELVYLMSEMLNRMWVLLQLWTGVAMGYLALAHIYGRTVNALIVVVLTVTFIMFSITVTGLVRIQTAAVDGYVAELGEMMDAGSLSQGTMGFLQERSSFDSRHAPLFGASVLMLFFCAVCYLPYVYWKGWRERR